MAQLKDTLITGDLAVTGNFPSKVFYLDATFSSGSYYISDLYTSQELYNLMETKLSNGYLIVLRVTQANSATYAPQYFYLTDIADNTPM